MARSLKEFVWDNCYNELFDATQHYIVSHRTELDLYNQNGAPIRFASLEDYTIQKVYVSDGADGTIQFDVIIDTEIKTSSFSDNEAESKSQWFMLSCSCNIENGFSDFIIHHVEIYNKHPRTELPLSDALVPYMSAKDLDDYATKFLQVNYSEALQKCEPVDVSVLVNRMGLTVIPKSITPDLSVFGAVFFKECDTQYHDREQNKMLPLHVKKGTILVDPQAFFLRNLGSVNNTIVHECVHWFFHRKVFALESLYNVDVTQIRCRVVGGIQSNQTRNATDWMEWQANALAPRILMPCHQFKRKAQDLIFQYQKKIPSKPFVDILEPVIREIATFYGVSLTAAKIRMIDVGYYNAIGVLSYIDGQYIKPYAFKKDSISQKQTYSIGICDALIQSLTKPILGKALAEGAIKYIDSHFVLNDPKYVTSSESGLSIMTDYARLHTDECCLCFDLQLSSDDNRYGQKYYTDCSLFRDANSEITFTANYTNADADMAERLAKFKARSEDLTKLLKNLPNNFAGAMNAIIDWSDMTTEKIAEASDVNPRTIQRYRHDDNQSPSLETIIQLCIGMRLPPEVSTALIEKSGCRLTTSERDLAYKFILQICGSNNLTDCNRYLEALNLAPLGRTARENL